MPCLPYPLVPSPSTSSCADCPCEPSTPAHAPQCYTTTPRTVTEPSARFALKAVCVRPSVRRAVRVCVGGCSAQVPPTPQKRGGGSAGGRGTEWSTSRWLPAACTDDVRSRSGGVGVNGALGALLLVALRAARASRSSSSAATPHRPPPARDVMRTPSSCGARTMPQQRTPRQRHRKQSSEGAQSDSTCADAEEQRPRTVCHARTSRLMLSSSHQCVEVSLRHAR